MYRKITVAISVLMLIGAPQEADAKRYRNKAAIAEFKRLNHCPSTGKPRGPCPGYIIDHIIALACGGADTPANMQWQTVADAKAKDKWERNGCTYEKK